MHLPERAHVCGAAHTWAWFKGVTGEQGTRAPVPSVSEWLSGVVIAQHPWPETLQRVCIPTSCHATAPTWLHAHATKGQGTSPLAPHAAPSCARCPCKAAPSLASKMAPARHPHLYTPLHTFPWPVANHISAARPAWHPATWHPSMCTSKLLAASGTEQEMGVTIKL